MPFAVACAAAFNWSCFRSACLHRNVRRPLRVLLCLHECREFRIVPGIRNYVTGNDARREGGGEGNECWLRVLHSGCILQLIGDGSEVGQLFGYKA
jgi:hypothetical protein